MQPIITIVGFLGSGKTTLLRQLTTDFLNESWTPHIILNDYQNAQMDAQGFLDLIPKEKLTALSGSCICCTGVNELRQAVNDVPPTKNTITLIEANGTTDAATLMEFLGVGLKEFYAPPVQVSVIDARYWQKRGIHNELESNQIQVSSLVILNFAGEISSQRLDQVTLEVTKINPHAKIKLWKEINALDISELTPVNNIPEKMDHLKAHWSSCSVDLPDPMESKTLQYVLDNLPEGIIRVKACTKLDNEETYSFIEKTPNSEPKIKPYMGKLISGTKLLAIGPGSNPEMLENLIKQKNLELQP